MSGVNNDRSCLSYLCCCFYPDVDVADTRPQVDEHSPLVGEVQQDVTTYTSTTNGHPPTPGNTPKKDATVKGKTVTKDGNISD